MISNEPFWLYDPMVLLKNLKILPTADMTNSERLNALTRLLLIITTILYVFNYEQWVTVLGLGLLLIIILFYNKPYEHFGYHPEVTESQALKQGVRTFDPVYDAKPHGPKNQPCWFNQNTSLLNAAYEVTPAIQFNHDDAAKRSYMNAKYELIPQQEADGFTQIWRNEPGMCGGYSMTPDPLTQFPVEELESHGQCNYIVRSNVDHLPAFQSGLVSARPMAEMNYNESMSNFRTGLIAEHVDRFRRERQHNCPDMKLNAFAAGSGYS